MRLTFAFLLACFSTAVMANTLEEVRKQTEASISEAVSNIRYKCKCNVTFDVNWGSFPNAISMRKAQYTVDNFNKAMPSFCADDGREKACRIKAVRISYGFNSSSKFSNGVAEFITNGVTHEGFDNIIDGLEKK